MQVYLWVQFVLDLLLVMVGLIGLAKFVYQPEPGDRELARTGVGMGILGLALLIWTVNLLR